MQTQPPEVADVFRAVVPQLSELNLYNNHKKIFQAIINCRTAKLGAHKKPCNNSECTYEEISYNSCLNRHCPKCKGGEAFSWVNERMNELLPVPYFHVVFTLPSELRELTFANKKLLYNLLFQSSAETLTEISRNNLSIDPGFFGVLHTWNQELMYHPHVHYLVPGGGVCSETNHWKAAPGGSKFFLPVRILSKVFRGKFIHGLKLLYRNKKLFIPEKLSHLNNPQDFERLISRSAKSNWVVYAKRPFASPQVVVKYLASYTHRVGISNSRLSSVTDTAVTFLARDKNNPGKRKPVTLANRIFVRRFLQHSLPKGFRRIRYFGWLSVHQRASKLAELRAQLGAPVPAPLPPLNLCPKCGVGTLSAIGARKPHRNYLESSIYYPETDALCLGPPL